MTAASGGSDAPALRTMPAPPATSRQLHIAHEQFIATGVPALQLRPVVADSWRRCAESGVDPEGGAPLDLVGAELEEYRQANPMAAVMPTVRELLVDDALEHSFIIVVSDNSGRVLWVEGDHRLRSGGEHINLVEGSNWSEDLAGTNAAGTALSLDRAVQVTGAEHFKRRVQPWNCAAAPVRDPSTGLVLGTVDVTGGDVVAAPNALTMVKAVVAAAEGELRLRQLIGAGRHAAGRGFALPPQVPPHARLEVLGTDAAVLHMPGRTTRLSQRHGELLFLLAMHPEGLTAEQLSVRLHEHEVPSVTIRAEMSRLRRILGGAFLVSRPYRILERLDTDVDDLRRALDRGAFGEALDLYGGPVLPRSESPTIGEVREEVRRHLRDTLLGHASPELLLRYAEESDGREDVAVWQACLDRLPAESPTYTRVRSQLDWLHGQLSLAT